MKRVRVLSLPGRKFRGLNPFFGLFCDSLQNSGVDVIEIKSLSALTFRYDVVHVHFPEHYITEQTFISAIKWTSFYAFIFMTAKALGKTFVWQVHDVHPFKHRHQWLLKPYLRLIHRLTDAHVFLSESSKKEFHRVNPASVPKPYCMAPHGPFEVGMSDTDTLNHGPFDCRDPSNPFKVGYLGSIKDYKNPAALRLLPANLPNGRPVQIVLAGKADDTVISLVTGLTGELRNVVRVDKKLTSNELNQFIRDVDVVYLPYKVGWNSGFAMLVLSNRNRILASDLEIFKELSSDLGSPWITASSPEGMRHALASIEEQPFPTDEANEVLSRYLSGVSFSVGAANIASLYGRLQRKS